MFKTVNKALEFFAAGDRLAAWKCAQLDEGLNEGVTMEQWLAWAEKAIARRKAEAELHSWDGSRIV